MIPHSFNIVFAMPKECRDQLSKFLKEARINAGYSQSDVAKILGYTSPQYISNIERGQSDPPVSKIKILIELYKLDLNHLVTLLVRVYEEDLREAILN